MDISRLADKLRSQNFAPDDSVILSAINHPLTAAQKGADWFAGQVNRAANIPDQYDNPNPLAGYTPEQQVGGALNLAGLMQTGAFPFAPKGAGATFGAIPVSHGSAHGPFSEMDFSKMGTGAGAQAYGHGGYFGSGYDSPVAMKYVPRNEKFENKLQSLYDLAEKRNQYPAMEVYEQYMLNKTPEDVAKYLSEALPDYSRAEQFAMKSAHAAAEKAYQGQKGSYLYNADLKWSDPERELKMPMSDEHFLHWDKPLNEQSDYVLRALLNSDDEWKNYVNNMHPDYKSLAEKMATGKEAVYGDEGAENWDKIMKYYPDLDHNQIHDVKYRIFPQQDDMNYLLNTLNGKAAGSGVQGGGGHDIYSFYGGDKEASDYLNSIGIPGLKYYDPDYGTGKNVENYVIFDPKNADFKTVNSKEIAKKLRGK